MSSKIVNYQHDLLVNSRECFYMDLCSLESLVGFILAL